MPNYTFIWLLTGSLLCLTELFLPSAFVTFMMGISALLVALISLAIANLWLQVIAWLVLSAMLIIILRRFFQPRHRKSKIRSTVIGETLTEILPGHVGRVLYEGNSWQAKCDDNQLSLPAKQRVYIVRREGTTLIIMPENLLD